MENLYNYVLHYNPYIKIWHAIPTKQYTRFFADKEDNIGVYSASTINALIKLIK